MGSRVLLFLLHNLFWLLLSCDTCHGVKSDIRCLETLKLQLQDPNKNLESWSFDNITEGSICEFNGIECWHPDESKVLNIRLSYMGLRGQFPSGLKNCSSMTGLDLSNNNLSGSLPGNIDEIIPFVVTLDLSSNNFSGNLPAKLGNITYLNVLNLQHNQFSGQIPWQFGRLSRLSTFNVADNPLSGQIPLFSDKSFPAENFTNTGLCGRPLEDCIVSFPGPSISSNFSEIGPKVPRKKAHFPWVIIGVSIPGILIFMSNVVRLFVLYRRKSNNKTTITKDVEMFLKNNGSFGPKRYKYSEVKKMTNSFRDKIGRGGFGCVFKGRVPDGRLVAVKVLSESKGNGQDFINEVASIGKTYHVNVVSLLGFCFEGSKRALIYEYMPNGSLDRYIYGEKPRSMNPLGWDKLYKIALEIARGLEYLHVRCSMRILHLDVKPHNILLDDNFCPKISDFGLAKLCPTKESTISTLTPRGTIGYAAPEVHCRNFGGVSYKSDVYSYGMMVLEMVGGRRNIDAEAETSQIYFPQWIYTCLNQQGSDIRVEGLETGAEEEMARKMILVGLWCIQMSPADRPSMSQVVEMFQGSNEDVPMPPNPFPPPPR